MVSECRSFGAVGILHGLRRKCGKVCSRFALSVRSLQRPPEKNFGKPSIATEKAFCNSKGVRIRCKQCKLVRTVPISNTLLPHLRFDLSGKLKPSILIVHNKVCVILVQNKFYIGKPESMKTCIRFCRLDRIIFSFSLPLYLDTKLFAFAKYLPFPSAVLQNQAMWKSIQTFTPAIFICIDFHIAYIVIFGHSFQSPKVVVDWKLWPSPKGGCSREAPSGYRNPASYG